MFSFEMLKKKMFNFINEGKMKVLLVCCIALYAGLGINAGFVI